MAVSSKTTKDNIENVAFGRSMCLGVFQIVSIIHCARVLNKIYVLKYSPRFFLQSKCRDEANTNQNAFVQDVRRSYCCMIRLAIHSLRFKNLQNFIPRFTKHGKIGTSFIGGATIKF